MTFLNSPTHLCIQFMLLGACLMTISNTADWVFCDRERKGTECILAKYRLRKEGNLKYQKAQGLQLQTEMISNHITESASGS